MEKDEVLRRIAVCKFALKTIEQVSNDPRYPIAKEFYEGQLKELESKLAEFDKPPDIVVGLNTAKLSADVN